MGTFRGYWCTYILCSDILNINMTATLSSCATPHDKLLENSLLYKEFVAEREEILRNKWYMSEKAGKDVGFERALMDWVSNHRCKWRLKRS